MKKILTLVLAVILTVLPLASLAEETFEPWYATAYMEIKFTCGCSRYGTGAMVGRYGLLTCAHNLFCPDHGVGLDYCNFYFGHSKNGKSSFEYKGKFTYYAYDQFTNGYSDAKDVGLVIFNEPVGDTTGWFATSVVDDAVLKSNDITVLNYNAEGELWKAYDIRATIYNATRFSWPEILRGTEGGPVFIWEAGDEFPYIVGFYTSFNDDMGLGIGYRMTMDLFNDMKELNAFSN